MLHRIYYWVHFQDYTYVHVQAKLIIIYFVVIFSVVFNFGPYPIKTLDDIHTGTLEVRDKEVSG